MNWKDVRFIGEKQVDIYELKVGDYFVEDSYSCVYRVDKIFSAKRGGEYFNIVSTTDMTNNSQNIEWFHNGSNPFCLNRCEPK